MADTGKGRKRQPFSGLPVLNYQNLMTSQEERGRFYHHLQGFQSLRYHYYTGRGEPVANSEAFVTEVLGPRHYTFRTYRRYLIWEFENHRIVVNRDFGYDIEIRTDKSFVNPPEDPKHLEAAKEEFWKVWAEARKPFEDFAGCKVTNAIPNFFERPGTAEPSSS